MIGPCAIVLQKSNCSLVKPVWEEFRYNTSQCGLERENPVMNVSENTVMSKQNNKSWMWVAG